MTEPLVAPEYVYKAQERKLDAEARFYDEQAKSEAVRAAMEQRKWADIQAGDPYHRVYRFDSEVSGKSVKEAINQINLWRRQEPGCPIEVIFSSPGGEVVAGMAFWDFLNQVRKDGHELTTGAQGYAASMAGILLQAGDKRWIGRESYILIHEIQAGMMGSWGELEDRMKWLEKVQSRILDIFALRCSQATGGSKDVVRKRVAKEWKRTDWWLDSTEALSLGFVDEVR